MVDVFLYPGEPDPEEIRLSDPTQPRAGGLTITPESVSCRALVAAGPVLVLGSVEVSPAGVGVVARAFDPIVEVGEGLPAAIPVPLGGLAYPRLTRRADAVTVRPAPITCRAAGVDPELLVTVPPREGVTVITLPPNWTEADLDDVLVGIAMGAFD